MALAQSPGFHLTALWYLPLWLILLPLLVILALGHVIGFRIGRRSVAVEWLGGLGRKAHVSTLTAADQDERCASALNELFASRFSSLPADCGQNAEPGVNETEEWRHWVSRKTTPDQRRIENYLKTLPLRGKRILHVGVGNSGFAKTFAKKCQLIRGITISDEELALANSLNIRNYECVKDNKYSRSRISGKYDIILDNNPTGFACCWRHFVFMVRKYREALDEGGIILTDKVGLAWLSSNQQPNSRWSFNFHDWDSVAREIGFKCVAIDDFLIAWTHPGAKIPRIKHYMLQALRKPAVLLLAKSAAAREMRKILRVVLRRRDDGGP